MHRRPRVAILVLLALLFALVPRAAQATELTKLVDPDTSASWTDLFGADSGPLFYSTEEAGRIWVDKSVYANADEASAAGLPVTTDPGDHGFVVGLSALASAVSERQEGGPAHDVVFVVSTNRLLADVTYGGRPQAAYLADALNQAISRLMAENDDAPVPTRVAVIGYDSKVTTMMPLGTYAPDESGSYVTYANGALSVSATATVPSSP